ncbi:subunit A of DNA gyrase/topoisomerase IV [Helicosporidium sp. ATCC 50920]|nr:subunit A of DNA gyrase/topoisomerase IV [Helicosporidium sp. ATCC 50920]|eukprot:KDD76968.1 subunit A of DNA gyrase/topoisomerase IV [Helicosporidium sp. ATCC 50920]
MSDERASPPPAKRVIETELWSEAKQSYLSYAMSVIAGRALPDVRDGLKPVHRRILFASHELGLSSSKPFKKCARVVGEVLGKFHPHGETAVYDALVRLSQPFAMRVPLMDGHGNFGSLDADPPAAMRYTECRLQKFSAAALLRDLDLGPVAPGVVDSIPNFDNSLTEPTVLPARVPTLLINGSSGIAVGIATRIPPHNMNEVVEALCVFVQKGEDCTLEDLMAVMPAPDFPTGGVMTQMQGLRGVYATGKGSFLLQARMHVEGGEEEASGEDEGAKPSKKNKPPKPARASLVMTELPYQTNKAALVAQLAQLADSGALSGVHDVRDESDRHGTRVVVEAQRGVDPAALWADILCRSAAQSRVSANVVAVTADGPQTLGLMDCLREFLTFRCEVIRRRAEIEVNARMDRLHIVEGLLAVLGDLDRAVQAVRAARDGAEAVSSLRRGWDLSEAQAEGVLALTLRRLTSLERERLEAEAAGLAERLAELRALLSSRERVLDTVVREAREVAAEFGTPRRTTLAEDGAEAAAPAAETAAAKPSALHFSAQGLLKRTSLASTARSQKGELRLAAIKPGIPTLGVVGLASAPRLLLFTPQGSVHCLETSRLPAVGYSVDGTLASRLAPRVKALGAVLALRDQDKAEARAGEAVALRSTVVCGAADATIKRLRMEDVASTNTRGTVCFKGLERVPLVAAVRSDSPQDSLLLASRDGYVLHVSVAAIRRRGRKTMGLACMGGKALAGLAVVPDWVLGAEEIGEGGDEEEEEGQGAEEEGQDDAKGRKCDNAWIVLVTSRGRAKRMCSSEIELRSTHRAQGARAVHVEEGESVVAVLAAPKTPPMGTEAPTLLVYTGKGRALRVGVEEVPLRTRAQRPASVLAVEDNDPVVNAHLL